MNKQDLINAIAAEHGIKKYVAAKIMQTVEREIKEALARGDTVKFVDFGTYRVTATKAREGRNPKTGEPLTIPARNRVVFKAGKKLTDAVNE